MLVVLQLNPGCARVALGWALASGRHWVGWADQEAGRAADGARLGFNR